MQIPVDGEVTQEAIDMIQLMGFSGFDTSKGKAHTDGAVKAHGSSIQVKRKYRQYMNRRGGFNRPLDKVAWIFFCFFMYFLVYETFWNPYGWQKGKRTISFVDFSYLNYRKELKKFP